MKFRTTIVLLLSLALTALAAGQDGKDRQRQEEAADYYKKWLTEDVAYIITEQEREIFEKLDTAEEKEQFIEQFWRRRDPDPRTPANEFKEEHYRRIAYANDHFKSGFAGWKTDRGRIYIIHGEPDEIERNPSGGGYERPIHEGGGGTATYPFERWWYRHIPGLGDDIELEFVDKTWTGEYKLALNASDKDVFLYVPGHGNTRAENLGMASRMERLTFSRVGASRDLYPMMHHRAKDSAFARYSTFTRIKQPAELKYADLKSAVEVEVSYDELPYRVQADYFRIGGDRYLVPVTVEFPNSQLHFELQNGVYLARIALYGVVATITNRIVAEFEEEMVSSFSPEQIEKGRSGRTVFQKLLPLKGNMRYKLTLVAKDVAAAKMGVVNHGLVPPSGRGGALSASSLVVADYIERMAKPPADIEEQFVLGDMKVRPTLSKKFPKGGVLGLYLQVYDSAIDQATQSPALEVTYRISQDGKTLREIVDLNGSSLLYYSGERAVVVKGIPLKELPEGQYQVEVEVEDRIADENVVVSERFRVTPVG